MKPCNGLWIVAPITRAVKDKTAKNLLGEFFRRQMKYGGSYSAVTFICSKTDEILVAEAKESFHLEEQLADLFARIDDIKNRQRSLKEEVESPKGEKAALNQTRDSCDARCETYDDLKKKLQSGKIMYQPAAASSSPDKQKKRKKLSRSAKSTARKRLRFGDDDDVDFELLDISDSDPGTDESDSDKENCQTAPARKVLTSDDIDDALSKLKREKKRIRESTRSVKQKLKDLQTESVSLKATYRNLQDEVLSICIQSRNEYSKRAVRQDFAMGMKEMDEGNAADTNPAEFDAEQELRGYDKVAKCLPVFCVSSHANQSSTIGFRWITFSGTRFHS
jgi:prefoldin subunit 5